LNLSSQQQFHLNGISQGNTVYVQVTHQYHTQLFTALGEMRKSGERIADHLAKDVNFYLSSQSVVDEYLADQLLLPLALGQGG
ncbi:RNA 3'-phosphate cyclase, partial [Acinetobacter baumannii]